MPPSTWPLFRLSPTTTVRTGDVVKASGIYLPSCSESCAALLIKNYEAPNAMVGYDPKTMQNTSESPTTWTLVERVADTGGGIAGDPDPTKSGVRLLCEAGQPCPRDGVWFTPARKGSRRLFTFGELMPEVGGDYGATIWQWDEQQ